MCVCAGPPNPGPDQKNGINRPFFEEEEKKREKKTHVSVVVADLTPSHTFRPKEQFLHQNLSFQDTLTDTHRHTKRGSTRQEDWKKELS